MRRPAGQSQVWTVILDRVLAHPALPATMKLLGRYNWYLQRWLRWLPQVSSSTPPPAAQPPRQPVTVA